MSGKSRATWLGAWDAGGVRASPARRHFQENTLPFLKTYVMPAPTLNLSNVDFIFFRIDNRLTFAVPPCAFSALGRCVTTFSIVACTHINHRSFRAQRHTPGQQLANISSRLLPTHHLRAPAAYLGSSAKQGNSPS